MVLVGLFLTLTLGFRVLRLGVLVSGLAFGLEFRVFVLFRASCLVASLSNSSRALFHCTPLVPGPLLRLGSESLALYLTSKPLAPQNAKVLHPHAHHDHMTWGILGLQVLKREATCEARPTSHSLKCGIQGLSRLKFWGYSIDVLVQCRLLGSGLRN